MREIKIIKNQIEKLNKKLNLVIKLGLKIHTKLENLQRRFYDYLISELS